MSTQEHKPVVLLISGSKGSGKTSTAEALARTLRAVGCRVRIIPFAAAVINPLREVEAAFSFGAAHSIHALNTPEGLENSGITKDSPREFIVPGSNEGAISVTSYRYTLAGFSGMIKQMYHPHIFTFITAEAVAHSLRGIRDHDGTAADVVIIPDHRSPHQLPVLKDCTTALAQLHEAYDEFPVFVTAGLTREDDPSTFRWLSPSTWSKSIYEKHADTLVEQAQLKINMSWEQKADGVNAEDAADYILNHPSIRAIYMKHKVANKSLNDFLDNTTVTLPHITIPRL